MLPDAAINFLSCRICLSDDDQSNLFSPCDCKGSSKYVHRSCLERWRMALQTRGQLKRGEAMRCETCQSVYMINDTWLSNALFSNSQEISFVFSVLFLTSLGIVWHAFDPIHESIALITYTESESKLPRKPWERPSITSTLELLQTMTCSTPPNHPLCLPSNMSPFHSLLTPPLLLLTFTVTGTTLLILALKTTPPHLSPAFYVLHFMTYILLGSIHPFTLFDGMVKVLEGYFEFLSEALGAWIHVIGALCLGVWAWSLKYYYSIVWVFGGVEVWGWVKSEVEMSLAWLSGGSFVDKDLSNRSADRIMDDDHRVIRGIA